MDIQVSLDLSQAQRNIQQLKFDLPKAVTRTLASSVRRILVPNIKRQIRKNKSIFRRFLINSLEVEIVSFNEPEVRVVSYVPHAVDVEKGSPPRFVSKAEKATLIKYIKQKNKVKNDRDIFAMLTAIIKTIQSEGTKAHPYMVPSFEASKDQLRNDIVERLKKRLAFRNK